MNLLLSRNFDVIWACFFLCGITCRIFHEYKCIIPFFHPMNIGICVESLIFSKITQILAFKANFYFEFSWTPIQPYERTVTLKEGRGAGRIRCSEKSKASRTYKNLFQFLSKCALDFSMVAISTAKEFCAYVPILWTIQGNLEKVDVECRRNVNAEVNGVENLWAVINDGGWRGEGG